MYQLLRFLPLLAWLLISTSEAEAFCCCGLCGCCQASDATDGPAAADGDLVRYRYFGGRWPGAGNGNPITITYSYNNFLDGGLKNLAGESLTPDYLRTVTEEAFGLWASVVPLHFVEVPDVGTPVFTGNTIAYQNYSADSFGEIRLNHRFINGTDAQNGRPVAKALAWGYSSGAPLRADIHFDNGDPWEVIGTASEPDVLGILTHEIGHTIGLGHSDIDGAVMFPAALRRSGPGTGLLTQDDIDGIQSIYGAGVGSVTPLRAVPEPTSGMLALGMLVGWWSYGVGCGNRRCRIG